MTASPALARQAEVLDALASQVEALDRKSVAPVIVFDLDDTLLSTDLRHIRILREFASSPAVRARHLEEAWRLVQLEPGQLRYGITDTAKAAGVANPAVLSELKEFWFERFFKNEYLSADEPVPGAVDYCQELLARGATLIYMTGRDEAMRAGTLSALSRHGFPEPDGRRVLLILKPEFGALDIEFKAQTFVRIVELGPVVGAFENEPAHINLFRESFPEARMVFVDTKHSGKPVAPHPAVHWIKDFLRA